MIAAAKAGEAAAANDVSFAKALAYAAPGAGAFFFYIPMWSILPGMYAKHYGVSLSAVAAVVLTLRLFDGAIIPLIGYLSDRHYAGGGSRKPWIVCGYLGVILACYFLFQPPEPATASYYLTWSLVYFLAFMVADIPHVTWGNELTLEYQGRARIFGIRAFVQGLGVLSFYALPLLPFYATSEYTPEVLKDAVLIGAAMTIVGLAFALKAAPVGLRVPTLRQDSARLLLQSLVGNRPLQVYFLAFMVTGVCYGMWFGLVYFYLDSYLGHGGKIALIFLLANVLGTAAIPLLLKLIGKTNKSITWAIGIGLFILQQLGAGLLTPGAGWGMAFVLVLIAHLSFNCHNVAALAILGDIADYGKLKFHQDRTATYFAVNNLAFQVAIGLGGGLALALAGHFGFDPKAAVHSGYEVLGMKLGFVIVPSVLMALALPLIWRTPLTRRRHRIIQRRLESRLVSTVS